MSMHGPIIQTFLDAKAARKAGKTAGHSISGDDEKQ